MTSPLARCYRVTRSPSRSVTTPPEALATGITDAQFAYISARRVRLWIAT
jgi:hypothetical protein